MQGNIGYCREVCLGVLLLAVPGWRGEARIHPRRQTDQATPAAIRSHPSGEPCTNLHSSNLNNYQ
jgi:hypothetical protein